jgi:hypothetical protein
MLKNSLHCGLSNIKTLLSLIFLHRCSLGKKVAQLKIDPAKLPVNEIEKIGEIWKELDQMKRMRQPGIFFDHSFRRYSSLEMTCLKRNLKTAAFFCD